MEESLNVQAEAGKIELNRNRKKVFLKFKYSEISSAFPFSVPPLARGGYTRAAPEVLSRVFLEMKPI